jgi:hypothetical protein
MTKDAGQGNREILIAADKVGVANPHTDDLHQNFVSAWRIELYVGQPELVALLLDDRRLNFHVPSCRLSANCIGLR